ncbi:MAG TPA: phage major capsid protein [Trebonia sp.]|jgi:HK97 family phage major capsid protein|nr:phage major capsid protein [Trebonia sp.]
MTTPPIAPLDFSGLIPIEYSTQIIQEALQRSAVLQLANLVPMGTGIAEMPVPTSLPQAGWVSVAGGRKPYTALGLGTKTLHAEEVAAVTAIPDVYLEDVSINLWGWVRPRLAEAIAIAIDEAILFGHNNPATFPAGGVLDPAYSIATPAGFDAADTVNNAMAAVEAQGLQVNGDAADLTVKGMLRGLRDSQGALLLGFDQINGRDTQTLWGQPITYTPFITGNTNFITGDWSSLVVGVRQDIRYLMDPSGVIVDDTGAVAISGFQDNTTPLKVWARFACTIINPVTRQVPAGAKPFAQTKLAGWVPPAAATSQAGTHAPAKSGTAQKPA